MIRSVLAQMDKKLKVQSEQMIEETLVRMTESVKNNHNLTFVLGAMKRASREVVSLMIENAIVKKSLKLQLFKLQRDCREYLKLLRILLSGVNIT